MLEELSSDLREVSLSRRPVHIRSLQFSKASIVIEMLDQETLTLMHEDSTFV